MALVEADLRKKELLKKAVELEDSLAKLSAEHKELLDQASLPESGKPAQNSPEKGGETRKHVRSCPTAL